MINYCEPYQVTECVKRVDVLVTLREEYVCVVKWIRTLSLSLEAPVRTPTACQSTAYVFYIQLTMGNNPKAAKDE